MTTKKHIEQLNGLARKLSEPLQFPGDLRCDAAAIDLHGDQPFVAALSPMGTQLFWLYLSPNPWKSLTRFLECTKKSLPGVRYWLLGLSDEPLEVSEGSSEREHLFQIYSERMMP